MAVKYKGKFDRVRSLDADFKQVPPVQTFLNFHNIVMSHQLVKGSRNIV